jgi:hypothetical protein
VIAELVEADFDNGTAETDAPGFFCKWTDACGNDLDPAALGGTLAVSFLLSVVSGAGATLADGLWVATGGIVADGNTEPGAFGASGGAPASEAGLVALGGGGTAATDGALGTETPAPAEGGVGGPATIGGPAGAEGGGTTPGIDGGFGTTGGVTVWPVVGETPGALGSGGIGGGTTDVG